MKTREAIALLEQYGLDELRPVLRELVSEGMMRQDGVQYVGPAGDAPGKGVVAKTQQMRKKDIRESPRRTPYRSGVSGGG